LLNIKGVSVKIETNTVYPIASFAFLLALKLKCAAGKAIKVNNVNKNK